MKTLQRILQWLFGKTPPQDQPEIGCDNCGWQGNGKDLVLLPTLHELVCPNCKYRFGLTKYL